MMRKIVYVAIIGVLCVFPTQRLFAELTVEDQASGVAQEWLSFVDAKNFEESWDQAATLFKQAVTLEQWQDLVSSAREPYGDLISRKELSQTYLTQLPNAPEGEYVVVVYEAIYQNKDKAIETVTPMKDSDGKWRVSGYYIK